MKCFLLHILLLLLLYNPTSPLLLSDSRATLFSKPTSSKSSSRALHVTARRLSGHVQSSRQKSPTVISRLRDRLKKGNLHRPIALATVLISKVAEQTLAPPIPTSTVAAASSVIKPSALGTFQFLPSPAEMELIFRLAFASLTGSLIGFERSRSDRPAGIRTMALVSLGAASFTLCSLYGFIDKYDTSRMASNVASGVGFIGAGVITNNRKANGVYDKTSSVRGLTTAAAIWVSAAVGVCAGTGLYFVGLVAAISTIAILRIGKVGGFDHESREEQKERDEEERMRKIKEQEKKEKKEIDATNKANKLLALEPVKVVKLDNSSTTSSSSPPAPSTTTATPIVTPTLESHNSLDASSVPIDPSVDTTIPLPTSLPAERVKIVEPLLTKYIKGKDNMLEPFESPSKKRYEDISNEVELVKKTKRKEEKVRDDDV